MAVRFKLSGQIGSWWQEAALRATMQISEIPLLDVAKNAYATPWRKETWSRWSVLITMGLVIAQTVKQGMAVRTQLMATPNGQIG
jgi:hypothetical protein